MESSFEKLKHTWETLGKEDPLWAIASEDDKKGNRWNLEDFLKSGEEIVGQYAKILTENGATFPANSLLDFGCGVGRLSLAWKRWATKVTGVDVSMPMVEKGRQLSVDIEDFHLDINTRPDLSLYKDGQFDVVFSHIVLQHIPWKYAREYLREFARITASEGWVVFQLPSKPLQQQLLPRIRRAIVDNLPFRLGEKYRASRRGQSVLFNMHFTPSPEVEAVMKAAGLKQVDKRFDRSAGESTEGFVYLYRKE
jgi:SAM-dependent methyltransferase